MSAKARHLRYARKRGAKGRAARGPAPEASVHPVERLQALDGVFHHHSALLQEYQQLSEVQAQLRANADSYADVTAHSPGDGADGCDESKADAAATARSDAGAGVDSNSALVRCAARCCALASLVPSLPYPQYPAVGRTVHAFAVADTSLSMASAYARSGAWSMARRHADSGIAALDAVRSEISASVGSCMCRESDAAAAKVPSSGPLAVVRSAFASCACRHGLVSARQLEVALRGQPVPSPSDVSPDTPINEHQCWAAHNAFASTGWTATIRAVARLAAADHAARSYASALTGALICSPPSTSSAPGDEGRQGNPSNNTLTCEGRGVCAFTAHSAESLDPSPESVVVLSWTAVLQLLRQAGFFAPLHRAMAATMPLETISAVMRVFRSVDEYVAGVQSNGGYLLLAQCWQMLTPMMRRRRRGTVSTSDVVSKVRGDVELACGVVCVCRPVLAKRALAAQVTAAICMWGLSLAAKPSGRTHPTSGLRGWCGSPGSIWRGRAV